MQPFTWILALLLLASNLITTFSFAAPTTTTRTTTTTANTMSPPKIKLTYFDIEAAAEPVRLALILSQTPFDDVRIPFADWPALKPTTPGGQLPVMTIDDGPMRTQSKAMLRWVGATLSTTLYPSDKLLDVEEAIGVVEDLSRAFAPALYVAMAPANYGYPGDFSKTEAGQKVVQGLREAFVRDELPQYCKRMADMMAAHGGKWLVAGDEPTLADCLAVPLLRGYTRGHMDHIPTDCLEKIEPKIVEYIKNFCALEGVKGRYTNGVF